MPAFLIGPNGPVEIEEIFVKPCPECDGVATTLTQQHQKTCTGIYGLCYKCHEWRVLSLPTDTVMHSCTNCRRRTGPPTSTALFDLPPQEYWGWRIEYRVWVRYTDNGDGWSEWTSAYLRGTKTYYMSERAARRALERKHPRESFGPRREYRVTRFAMKHNKPSKRRI